MILHFDEYTSGHKIASVARNEELLKILINQDLNVLFVNEDIILYPENIVLKLNENDKAKIIYLLDNDVVEIHESGKCFRTFCSDSPDNALLVTDKCNSNCLMCPVAESIRKNGSSKDITTIKEIIKYIPPFAEHITITGGEPFILGEGIFDVLSDLKKLQNTEYLLLTNGRAFSIRKYAEQFFKTSPPKIIIGIPLHGYNSETHDYITQSPGSFEQTFYGLKNILKYDVNVEIRIVVSKLNYSFISKIAELIVQEFGRAFCVKFIGLEMLGNAAKNTNKVWIPYHEAFESCEEAIDLLVSNGIDVGIYNFPLCTISKKYRYLSYKSITDYKIKYSDECKNCLNKDSCGGIFEGTIRLVDDLKPEV